MEQNCQPYFYFMSVSSYAFNIIYRMQQEYPSILIYSSALLVKLLTSCLVTSASQYIYSQVSFAHYVYKSWWIQKAPGISQYINSKASFTIRGLQLMVSS